MALSGPKGPALAGGDRAVGLGSLGPAADLSMAEQPGLKMASAAAPKAQAGRFRASDKRVEWVRGAVARYERPLTQYAMHVLGGDLERARDLVQEAFLRLCDQEESTVESHLAEWLYTVCRNLAIDSRRKERRMRLMSDEQQASFVADLESPTDAAERVDTYDRVQEAVQGLPPRQQEIVRLKFQHGMSYKEIGSVMNLTATNVGFILHTAIRSLRDRLEPESAGRDVASSGRPGDRGDGRDRGDRDDVS